MHLAEEREQAKVPGTGRSADARSVQVLVIREHQTAKPIKAVKSGCRQQDVRVLAHLCAARMHMQA